MQPNVNTHASAIANIYIVYTTVVKLAAVLSYVRETSLLESILYTYCTGVGEWAVSELLFISPLCAHKQHPQNLCCDFLAGFSDLVHYFRCSQCR